MDYDGFDTVTQKAYTIKDPVNFAVVSVLFILGILGNVMVLMLMLVKKRRTFLGLRLYCLNLCICQIINLVSLVANNPNYPFLQMMTDRLRKEFSEYYYIVSQWTNTVFCATTFVLIWECIYRSRSDRRGFHPLFWLFVCIAVDVAPAVFSVLKPNIWKYVNMFPDPMSTYHGVVFILCVVSNLIMLIFAIILICAKSYVNGKLPTFHRSTFYAIFFYVTITGFWQYLSTYQIMAGTMPSDNMNTKDMTELVQRFQTIITIFTNAKDYSLFSFPAATSILMIVFLPTISLLNCGIRTKISSSARVSDADEHHMTVAGDEKQA